MPKNTTFRRWLKAQNLSYNKFVEEINDRLAKAGLKMRIKYPTVVHWGAGRRHPGANQQELIRMRFPDCPLLLPS